MRQEEPQVADTVYFPRGTDNETQKELQKGISEVISVRREVYSKLHKPELLEQNNINVQRVKYFVESDVGKVVDCDIFSLDGTDRETVDQSTDIGLNGVKNIKNFNDSQTKSAVLFFDGGDNPLIVEAGLAHELVHLTGYRGLKLEKIDNNGNYGFDTNRMGMVTKSHGLFLEEMFASGSEQRYKEKFLGNGYFELVSSTIGKKVTGFDDFSSYTFSYSSKDGKDSVRVPLKYADIEDGELKARPHNLAAYAYKLLEGVVYRKTGENLKELMMEARSDPHKITKLAKVIDEAGGKGTYQLLRITKDVNSGGNGVIQSVKALQEKEILLRKQD